MPAGMFCDLEPNEFEDQRALQLAFELSMLGLSSNNTISTTTPGSLSSGPASEPETPTITSLPSTFIVPDEARSKKSQNMTECVPVPSSEHVAEIVGRQGEYHLLSVYLLIMCYLLEMQAVTPHPASNDLLDSVHWGVLTDLCTQF